MLDPHDTIPPPDDLSDKVIEMPRPTVAPMVLALGMVLLAAGAPLGVAFMIVGGLVLIGGLGIWIGQLLPGRGHCPESLAPLSDRPQPVLSRYVEELSVTGLTSNPTIFDHAIKNSTAYDAAIRKIGRHSKSEEQLFFELALEDIMQAADLFRSVWNRTNGVDGWVSLEVSPLLAHATANTVAAVTELHARADRPNIFIKIPGTKEGLPAIEEAIFAGVPVNVTLLFSREHYLAAAEAFLRGIERRIEAGLNPNVGSVASVFVSRWDGAVMGKVPESLRNRLGIAVAQRTYKAYHELLTSPRWQRAYNAGVRPQRLLWASTGTKDPKASDILYVEALAAPFTVNTMPEGTLKAFADHGGVGPVLPSDGGESEAVLAEFAKAGIDIGALAAQLQDEGAKSFVKSWNELMAVIATKSAVLAKAS